MKIPLFTAAALLALSVTAPVFAQNSAGPVPNPAVPPAAQGPIRGSSPTQNEPQQKAANGQLAPEQNAQAPAGCTPADQSCGNANGNPAVLSPTQKKEVPASPAPTTNP